MLVPFIAYALNRRFIGYLECEGEKIVDVLNRSETILVRDAFVENFEDDTVINLGDGVIDRAVVYAVESNGTSGANGRTIHTVRHRLQVQMGPYVALGLLHDANGQQPLPYLGSRGPMTPLTDATLGFNCRGQLTLRDVGSLVVNRELVDWVRAAEDEAHAFPGVPVLTDRR